MKRTKPQGKKFARLSQRVEECRVQEKNRHRELRASSTHAVREVCSRALPHYYGIPG